MKKLLRILVYGALALLLLTFISGQFTFDILAALSFGWWKFLSRTVPHVSVNWKVIGMALLCSGIILWALHSFCLWFVTARGKSSEVRWRFRSTAAFFGIVWALFFTTMGITGIVHQIAWLTTSNEPWAQRRSRKMHDYMDLQHHALEQLMALQDAGWDFPGAQQAVWANASSRGPHSPEHFQVINQLAHGEATNVIVFHRDPAVRARVQKFFILNPAQEYTEEHWTNISKYVPSLK